MSASTSPRDPPSSSSAREATSSPDDGDARSTPADFGVRFGARILDTLLGVGLGFGVAFPTVILLAALSRSGVIATNWPTKIAGYSFSTFA